MTPLLPPSIHISQLNISYRNHILFYQFNLSLPGGKWSSVLGPSGIGKTTLLRFIAGLDHGNETSYSGTALTSDRKSLVGRISYMTQHDSLLEWLSVKDNILLGYHLRSLAISNQLLDKVKTLLKQIGLEDTAQKKPRELSGGMRQRILLARTFMENREIVLLDEPFTAMDSITKLNLQNLAATLLKNKTVVFVTHDPMEALRLGHNVIVLNNLPVRVSHNFTTQHSTPRDPADAVLLEEYRSLIKILLNNGEHINL